MSKYRTVRKILPRPSPHWVGDGFKVYPVFADLAFTKQVSPLLMFDYGEPKHFPAHDGKPLGVGQHPHRGFETVTIAFQGEVEHHDSVGNSGVIAAGDVQWMTAGRGIIHEEYHSREFSKSGGTFEMCQLWVNLKAKDKMTAPKYQPILKEQIPTVPLYSSENDAVVGNARIIAGQLGDVKGPASTFSPVQVWDVSLPNKDTEVVLPFPSNHNCILFVRRGEVQVVNKSGKNSVLGPQDVAILSMDDGDDATSVKLRVNQPDSSVLVLGGEPIDEPIAAHGPFVMNTHEQINEAITDYRMGRFGR